MNVYFSCSITGGRSDEAVYQRIVAAMQADGHEVPTAILADPGVLGLEAAADPLDIYLRDVAWVESAHAVVAEVSTPSHGVGYEIALALSLGKPVLCCYQKGKKVSKMITGNNHPLIQVQMYDELDDAVTLVRDFLRNL